MIKKASPARLGCWGQWTDISSETGSTYTY